MSIFNVAECCLLIGCIHFCVNEWLHRPAIATATIMRPSRQRPPQRMTGEKTVGKVENRQARIAFNDGICNAKNKDIFSEHG